MSTSCQAPDSAITEIAVALDRIGLSRSPGPHRHGEGPARGEARASDGPGRRKAAFGARRMLHAIVHADGPQSITDLGRQIGVDQPRASRLVQALADSALVRRIPDPADGRRVVIEATAAGRARFQAHLEARSTEVAQAAEALSGAEQADLARLLGKLAAAWPVRG